MSFSFSIPSKPKSKSKTVKNSTTFADDDRPQTTTKTYVSEFNSSEPPQSLERKPEPIAPLPDRLTLNKKLKNLASLALESNPSDSALQFEIDTESQNPKTDDSMGFGLNLRARGEKEKLADMELRKLKEDLRNLPDVPEDIMDEFRDVPVEGFGLALLSGYGWKEGRGVGRNAKEDVKVHELTKRVGRGGLGFFGEPAMDNSKIDVGGEDFGKRDGIDENKKSKRKRSSWVGKEVRIVRGKEIGTKGKIIEERSEGELLVLRISRSDQRLKVRLGDVAEMGSEEESRCLRKLKELRDVESRHGDKDLKEKDKEEVKKRVREDDKQARNHVNWLRNNIRVRIVSEELKGGRLHLKKGVVVDVVGPGLCDVSMDENSELVQGVYQDWLETALPKRGGPVLVLFGSHKGVYGNLVERDSEKEMGVVRNADTHELLNVKLEQIAEYTGDPSDFDY